MVDQSVRRADSDGLEAVLLDLDGTLLDTAADLAAAVNRVLEHLGLRTRPDDVIATYIGKGIPKLVHRSLTGDMDIEAEPVLFARAIGLMEAFYEAESGRRAVAYPGVIEGLRTLRGERLRLAVVTNKAGRYTETLLDEKGLLPYFDVIVSGDSLPRKKPDPLPMVSACERLGVAPIRAVVIGDSANDVRAGRAAGCRVIGVTYGYNEGRPIDSESPDAIAPSFEAAVRRVLAWRSADSKATGSSS